MGTWNIEKISSRGVRLMHQKKSSKDSLSRSKVKKKSSTDLKNLRITITNDHLDAYSYYLKKESVPGGNSI